MRVAIVHYHLRAGGVTRVIQHAVRALRQRSVDAAILSGAASDGGWPCPVRAVAGLGYAAGADGSEDAGRGLAKWLKLAATRALGRAPDVWHIHNHALGKNPALTMAVRQLAAEGQRILLQIHDFAEDGRPALYRRMINAIAKGDPEIFGSTAYPQAPQVHYAALNQRDCHFLRLAGANPAFIHWLPNPVVLPPGDRDSVVPEWEGKRRFLYPTRALRRKNIGEALLWAVAGKPDDSFALTLAPTGRKDRAAYQVWKGYAGRWRLRIRFETGLTSNASLADWMRSASAIITTSVAEGFGLAFLEPWLAGRPVVGRDLPEITREFRDGGLCWPSLYDRLEVPLAWIGAAKFKRALYRGLKQSGRAYGRSFTRDEYDRAYSAAVRKDKVDFGRLDESLQLAVIDRIRCSPRLRRLIRPMNIVSVLKDRDIASNAEAIERTYNLEQYGARLMGVYDKLLQSRAGPLACLSAGRLLDQFLAPERFYLLRT